jgi:hypothetical protein
LDIGFVRIGKEPGRSTERRRINRTTTKDMVKDLNSKGVNSIADVEKKGSKIETEPARRLSLTCSLSPILLPDGSHHGGGNCLPKIFQVE